MFEPTHRHRLTKASYILSAGIILFVITLWITGPTIIEQAYHGESLPFFNAMISGQKSYPLEYYLSVFHARMLLLTVLFTWIVILSLNLALRSQTGSLLLKANKNGSSERNFGWFLSVLSYSFLILGSLFLLIVLHGKTYLSIMAADNFIFFDGAHRLSSGQVPHIDFHTPFGAAAYLLPYCGLLLKGNYAGSLELASFLLAVILTLFSIFLLRNRSSALFSALTILFLCFLVTIPIIGSRGADIFITHAMYYNRWGWAALTLVFITYISPNTYSTDRLALEAALLACLIVFLFFLKITYFIFGLTFLFLLASASLQQRRLAITAGIITLIILAVVEWRFRLIGPYIEDLRWAIMASGAVRKVRIDQIAANAAIPFLLILAALSILIKRKVLRWRDLFFVAFVSIAGLAIQNQNWGQGNLIVILAVLLWSHALIERKNEAREARLDTMDTEDARIMGILLVFFMAPQLISGVQGIYLLTVGVAAGPYQKSQIETLQSQVETLQGVYIEIQTEPPPFDFEKIDAETDRIAFFNELRAYRPLQRLSQDEYIKTLSEGVKLLKAHTVQSGKIITFDQTNPFNFLLGVPPSQGDYSWFNLGRNIDENAHEQAQDLFRDVHYVMVPTFPTLFETTQLLFKIYGEYLEREYVVLGKNKYWTLYGHPGVR